MYEGDDFNVVTVEETSSGSSLTFLRLPAGKNTKGKETSRTLGWLHFSIKIDFPMD